MKKKNKEAGDLDEITSSRTREYADTLVKTFSERWPELTWNSAEMTSDEINWAADLKEPFHEVVSNIPSGVKIDYIIHLICMLLPNVPPSLAYTNTISHCWNLFIDAKKEKTRIITEDDILRLWPEFVNEIIPVIIYVYLKMAAMSKRNHQTASNLFDVVNSKSMGLKFGISFGEAAVKLAISVAGKSLTQEDIDEIEDSASKIITILSNYVGSIKIEPPNPLKRIFTVGADTYSATTASLADMASFSSKGAEIELSALHKIMRIHLGYVLDFTKKT